MLELFVSPCAIQLACASHFKWKSRSFNALHRRIRFQCHWKRMRLVKCVEASRLPFEMRGTSHKVSSKMTCAIQCLHPAWVVAAQSAPAPANPALPLTAVIITAVRGRAGLAAGTKQLSTVMTKAKAAPKIGSRMRR